MADYNVDTLESEIVVAAQDAIKSLDQLIGKVNQTGNITQSNVSKLQLLGSAVKKAFNFSGIIYSAKKLYGALESSIKLGTDYVETLNLFEVSMGKSVDKFGNLQGASSAYYTKALRFQNELNEAFGTNIEQTMKYQALFNQMSKSLGIGNSASYTISENLTKLGIDMASLYNANESTVMEALRSGVLSGQTKSLKTYGIDVTQGTLAQTAAGLGIEESVSKMSQAEKVILRYITALKQASAAHGDFAKTLESPANQMKIFRQQLAELKTAIGNLFQGLIGQIMPYVNGVLMVIKELIKAIGSLFGFKVSTSTANLAEATGVEELNSGLGSAVGNAKALKAQLMGFDEINNITTDTSSGGAGGGASAADLGINSALLDSLSEYDNLMEKVKNKATEIRDKIMDWLGFTKVINPLTGDVSFKLKDGWTNLKKIWTIIKGLIGLGIAAKIVKLIGNLTNLWSVLKGTSTSTSAFATGMKTLKNIFTTTTAGIGKHATEYTMLNLAAIKVTTGIAGLVASLYGSYNSMKEYSEGAKKASTASLELAGSVAGATASGALIGTAFGPAGTVIGSITGYLLGAKAATMGYTTELDKNYEAAKKSAKEFNNYAEAIRLQDEAIQETVTNQLAEIDYTKQLTDELMNLVDANGIVREGYEARVSYILGELNEAYGTEYELIDGQIKHYDELKENIYKVIEAKRAEILQRGNETIYEEALKRENELYKKKADAIADNKNAIKQLEDELNEYNRINKTNIKLEELLNDETARANMKINARGDFYIGNMKKAIEYYETTLSTEKNAVAEWDKNSKKIIAYENLSTALIKEDKEEIERAINALTEAYNEATEEQTLTLKQQYEKSKEIKEQTLKYFKDNNLEITDDLRKSLDYRSQLVVDSLIKQTKDVKELSPEQIEAWKYLAENDKKVFNEAIKDLPNDARKKVQESTSEIVKETEGAIPSISKITEKIKNILNANMSGDFSVKTKLNVDYSDFRSKLITMRNTLNKMVDSPVVGTAIRGYRDNLNNLINQIYGYAEGGLPDMGEIFVAREAGPELVGKIGNKTAVVNNNQIVEAVSRGVYQAVASAMSNGSTSVQLDIRADEGIIVKKASQGFKDYVMKTGELPFPVPV